MNGFNLVGHWYACQVTNTFFSCLLFTIDGVLESSEATPNGASVCSFRSNLRGEVEVSERRPYHLTSIRQNAIRFFTKQNKSNKIGLGARPSAGAVDLAVGGGMLTDVSPVPGRRIELINVL